MKKEMILKISLFAFLSALICTVGNSFIGFDVLSGISHFAWFVAYIFALIWVSLWAYEKVKTKKYGKNILILSAAFLVAVYSGMVAAYSGIALLDKIFSVILYAFIIICIVAAISLFARIIFFAPKKEEEPSEDEAEETADKEENAASTEERE